MCLSIYDILLPPGIKGLKVLCNKRVTLKMFTQETTIFLVKLRDGSYILHVLLNKYRRNRLTRN